MGIQLAEVDRLLAPEFVEGIDGAPIDELRAKRDECNRAEVALSYVRRLLQGRLDIIRAEMDRRLASGGEESTSDLIDRLPEILAGPPPATTSAPSHLPLSTLPGVAAGMSDSLDFELSSIAGVQEPASDLISLDDEGLRRATDEIRSEEEALSARRRLIHERIDDLQARIVERYKAGDVDVAALLRREREP